jgi:hypothetical protein
MPPQQPDRLLDLFDEAFDFGAHVGALICGAGRHFDLLAEGM